MELSPISEGSNRQKESVGVSNTSQQAYEADRKRFGSLIDQFQIELITTYWDQFNLESLLPWQIECLESESVRSGNNFIFSAPTSAGKSLVADLLLLEPLVKRKVLNSANSQPDDDANKPFSIFVVPQISLITEKEQKLSPVLEVLGLTLQQMHSHRRAILSEQNPPDIVLCTMEKANQLMTRLIASEQTSRICSLVIDELHLIGDESRGFLLELLLTKAIFMNNS